MQDKIYKYLSLRYNDSGRPEYRLVVTQVRFSASCLRSTLTSRLYFYDLAVRYDNFPDRTFDLVLDSRKTNDLDWSYHWICYLCFWSDVSF